MKIIKQIKNKYTKQKRNQIYFFKNYIIFRLLSKSFNLNYYEKKMDIVLS